MSFVREAFGVSIFRVMWPTARLQVEARPDPTRRNRDALREGVDKEDAFGGSSTKYDAWEEYVGKIRQAPREVGEGRYTGGAVNIDGSVRSRSRPRRSRLVRRKRKVSSLNMFLISNSSGPPRRSLRRAQSRRRKLTTRQQMVGSREGSID